MSNMVFTQGIIKGMESAGAIFHKEDESHFFFSIEKGSFLDNDEVLQRAQRACEGLTGKRLRIRKID